MADDLRRLGFTRSHVLPCRLDLCYPDPRGRGPFCRLEVELMPPALAGAYAWVADNSVGYIGRSDDLRQVVHGARMSRAYDEYTYMPPSKVTQSSSPRVLVNGRLNAALVGGAEVTWWWTAVESHLYAVQLEARLLATLPPWNRNQPAVATDL